MKSKTTAILLAWLVHPALDFYLGRPGRGIAKILTLGGLGVWALIDAIRVTTMSDAAFAEYAEQGETGTGRWILIGIAAFVGVVVSCTVLAAVALDTAVEEAQNTRVQSCHYDATTNMSLIIEGTLGNSRSRTVTGNACD